MKRHSRQVQMLFQTRRGQHGHNRLMHNIGSKVENIVKPVRGPEPEGSENHRELISETET